MTPEGAVKVKVRRLLDKYGVYRFAPVQTGMGKPGLDFYCCHRGWFFAIETKAEGGRPTPRQRRTMDEIEAAGGAVFLIDGDAGIYALQNQLDEHL